jgi:hypothetical protein
VQMSVSNDSAVARPEPARPKLLDQVRQIVRAKHYSPRTEEAYVTWIKRSIYFHGKQHPLEMGAPEINQFLVHLPRTCWRMDMTSARSRSCWATKTLTRR